MWRYASRRDRRRPAGRKPGVPNKVSSSRVARVLAQGKKLPPDELLALAERAMMMVKLYQPTTGEKPKDVAAEERYAFWISKAGELLKAAAPYYAPKLYALRMAGEVHHTSNVSISQTLNVTMTPQEAMSAYLRQCVWMSMQPMKARRWAHSAPPTGEARYRCNPR
jgi:hypothetical protein